MNENIIKGKWNEFKGEIQRLWGEVTHDDLDRTKGNVKEVGGILERRYGSLKDEAKKSFDDLVSRYGDKAAKVTDDVRAKAEQKDAQTPETPSTTSRH